MGPNSTRMCSSPARIVSSGRVLRRPRPRVQHRPVARVPGRQRPASTTVNRVELIFALSARDALDGVVVADRMQPHPVTGAQLTELPPVGRRHRRRADEAAETRAVGAEHDRHVAGEVDRADRVHVVVDVRRVEPGLAAVGPRPLRGGPDEADAGAIRVMMHLPFGRVQHRDVVGGEEVGIGVRTGEHVHVPVRRVGGNDRRGDAPRLGLGPACARGCDAKRVAGDERRPA